MSWPVHRFVRCTFRLRNVVQDLKDAMQGQTHDSNMAASSMAVDAAVMSSDSSVRNEDVSEVSGCRDASAQPVQQECENCLSGDNTGAVGHVSSMPAQNEGNTSVTCPCRWKSSYSPDQVDMLFRCCMYWELAA